MSSAQLGFIFDTKFNDFTNESLDIDTTCSNIPPFGITTTIPLFNFSKSNLGDKGHQTTISLAETSFTNPIIKNGTSSDESLESDTTDESKSKDITKIEYACQNCDLIFECRMKFDEHYRSNYNSEPVYTCKLCNKHILNLRSFRTHYVRHRPMNYQCHMCAHKFTYKSKLDAHLSAHASDISYECNQCDKIFWDLVKFNTHRRFHRANERAKHVSYQCSNCDKICSNPSSLRMHEKTHKQHEYECSVCSHTFVQKVNLINHMKIHRDERPYNCIECGKSFVGRLQLLRHHDYHVNVKTFKCVTCDRMYSTQHNLKTHQLIHEDRQYNCTQCDKSFLSSSKLKDHRNTHTGDRPYKCKYCAKSFTNYPNWLKHVRIVHQLDHKTGEKLEKLPEFLKKKKYSKGSRNDKFDKETGAVEVTATMINYDDIDMNNGCSDGYSTSTSQSTSDNISEFRANDEYQSFSGNDMAAIDSAQEPNESEMVVPLPPITTMNIKHHFFNHSILANSTNY